MANHLIVIAGPTASGKTDLAIEVAQWLNAEIISADGRQFYKGMDIGTAKPTTEDLKGAPHHFIDILNPDQLYSAGQFERDVLQMLEQYFKRKTVAVLVGGSGLYINAVLEGFDELPAASTEVRNKYNHLYELAGIEALQNTLREKDPEYFQKVDIQNRQRVQRALEAMEMQPLPFSQLQRGKASDRDFIAHKILLMPERDTLYAAINARVDRMVSNGLLDEAESLLAHRKENALNTVGYKELFDYFDGKLSLDEAIAKTKQHSRNYAKRQTTWFKRQKDYAVFSSNAFEPIKKHLTLKLNV